MVLDKIFGKQSAKPASAIKADFPFFSSRKITYFDSACTSLKPRSVIDAEREYYERMSGCAGRSAHTVARETEDKFNSAREKVAKFVNADVDSVVWTKNTTEALNLVIRSLDYSKRSKVVASNLEHHSLLLPIMEQQRRGIVKMALLDTGSEGMIDPESISKKIDGHTALVAVHHTTNTTGIRSPLEEIIKAAHDNGALVLVDGAQGVPHSRVDFKKLGADFLAFSGHKMLGPTGIGCLVGKQEELERLDSFMVGGETVDTVSLDKAQYKKAPKRFEAGTQNLAGAIGMGAACDYLSKMGMDKIEGNEHRMAKMLIDTIQEVPGAEIYGSTDVERCALVSFNLEKKTAHETAFMCDSLSGIAMRSGVFCAQPAMEQMGAPKGAVRASLYVYNDEEEIRVLGETLNKIAKLG